MWPSYYKVSHSVLNIADVGYGLSTQYCSNGSVLQIDAGGQNERLVRGSLRNVQNADELILTHYHADHYMGLQVLQAYKIKNLYLTKVYVPPIPDIRFLAAYFITQMLTLGKKTGNFETDLFLLIKAVNALPHFALKRVFQGDVIHFGERKLRVIWPPRNYDTSAFKKKVRDVLGDYNEAIQPHKGIEEYTERLAECVERSALGFGERAGRKWAEAKSTGDENQQNSMFIESIEELKQDAMFIQRMNIINDKMRSIANHISLAFHDSDRILFLSDQENSDLKHIVSYLTDCGLSRFDCIVTAHHGTHWDNALIKLKARMTVTSNGEHGRRQYRKEWDSISWESKQTRWHGNIEVCFPVCSPC